MTTDESSKENIVKAISTQVDKFIDILSGDIAQESLTDTLTEQSIQGKIQH